jgi:hypothetical protein
VRGDRRAGRGIGSPIPFAVNADDAKAPALSTIEPARLWKAPTMADNRSQRRSLAADRNDATVPILLWKL